MESGLFFGLTCSSNDLIVFIYQFEIDDDYDS